MLLELGNNLDGKEALVERFLLAIARYLRGLVVPLVHISVHVDSEDGSVGHFHQLTEFIGYGSDGEVIPLGLCEVLSYPHHPYGGGIDEEISKLVGLRNELQLVVRVLDALQGVVHDVLHLLLKLGHNEGENQLKVKASFCENPVIFGLIFPLVDVPIDVDPKDLSVGRVDQLPEIIGDGRHSQLVTGCFCVTLDHPHQPHGVLFEVPARGGIDEEKAAMENAMVMHTIL